jgi:hypothetical protein
MGDRSIGLFSKAVAEELSAIHQNDTGLSNQASGVGLAQETIPQTPK